MKRRPNLKNGEERLDAKGYVLVKCPDHPACTHRGYIFKHRLIMEASIGRYLTGIEVVHHIDGNPRNNRIENLQLCKDNSEHQKIHRPERKCSKCDQPHFGKGLCSRHYNQMVRETGQYHTDECEICKKPLYGNYKYQSRDGKRLCQKCRWPLKKCRVCGKSPTIKGLCKDHYNIRFLVPCSKCGRKIRKGGRIYHPPVCWRCKFPKRKCRICGGKYEALGLCENHYKQLKRGTLTES